MGNIGKFRASEREYPLRNSFPSGEFKNLTKAGPGTRYDRFKSTTRSHNRKTGFLDQNYFALHLYDASLCILSTILRRIGISDFWTVPACIRLLESHHGERSTFHFVTLRNMLSEM